MIPHFGLESDFCMGSEHLRAVYCGTKTLLGQLLAPSLVCINGQTIAQALLSLPLVKYLILKADCQARQADSSRTSVHLVIHAIRVARPHPIS